MTKGKQTKGGRATVVVANAAPPKHQLGLAGSGEPRVKRLWPIALSLVKVVLVKVVDKLIFFLTPLIN